MNRKHWLGMVALIGAGTLGATGCTQDISDTGINATPVDMIAESENDKIYFIHDDERGVGIWVYDGYQSGGVAVLPDGEYTR